MKKYGADNFELCTLEECSDEEVNDREIYWIEQYQSFKYGYNATLGGDGKHYLDYDLICATYKQSQNCSEVAKRLGISPDSVSKVLKNRNIQIKTASQISRENASKVVNMFDKKGNYLKTFSSLQDAGAYIKESQNKDCPIRGISVHIRQVANGKRQTAYGYKWSWGDKFQPYEETTSLKEPSLFRQLLVKISSLSNGSVVQLVRTRACHARGQGFKSPRSRQSNGQVA